jgi:hypothetical protein
MGAIEIRTAAPTRPLLDRAAVENARLIRESRERLLTEAGAVTIAMLAEGRRSNLNAARQWLHRNRKAGRLVTVEHEGDVLIPTFQLDEAFDVDPVTAGSACVRWTRPSSATSSRSGGRSTVCWRTSGERGAGVRASRPSGRHTRPGGAATPPEQCGRPTPACTAGPNTAIRLTSW